MHRNTDSVKMVSISSDICLPVYHVIEHEKVYQLKTKQLAFGLNQNV